MGNGYQSNNPWLQELPDPISKVTWDNYLTISPVHTKKWVSKIGMWLIELNGDIVNLKFGDLILKVPVYIQPGQRKTCWGYHLDMEEKTVEKC